MKRRDYLWYALLFGTAGSGVVGGTAYAVDSRHTLFLYVFAVGICLMAALLAGWALYVALRALMHYLSGGA